MINQPAGSVIVKKIDNNNNFIEDVLDCGDINAVSLSGNQTISGTKTFSSAPQYAGSVSSSSDLTNKDYVDTALSGVSLATVAVAFVGPINTQTKSADGAVIVSSGLYMQTASGTMPGLLSGDAQTVAGVKTFTNDIVAQGHVITADIGSTSGSTMTNINGYIRESSPITTLSPAGDLLLDCTLKSTWRKSGGTSTITFSGMAENQLISLVIESTGSPYIITWSGETFRWPSGATPSPTAPANTFDVYTFMKIGGIAYSNAILSMK